MQFDSLIVFVHILAGSTLVALSSIMQLIVGPAVSTLSSGPEKNTLVEKLKKRRVPIMDSAIIIQILTAVYLLKARWNMIVSEPIMHVKILAGTIALTLAFLAHFYFRYKKVKLEKLKDTENLAKINKTTRIIEKTVLVSGLVTYLLGVYFNHM